MQTAELKKQLTDLIELQTVDVQIYALHREKDALPEEIKTIESVFENKKQRLLALETQLVDLQKKKKDFELEFASREEGAKKLQGQLFQLKTNKEYQTMLQQIADTKADGSVIEDKILQVMEQADKIKNDMENEKKILQGEEKIFIEQKNKIQLRIKEIDEKIHQIEVKRKQIVPNIDKTIFSQYERILVNRDGLAIVPVKNNSCQGCNMFVPAQEINLIKMYDKLVTCQMCNRILYVEEHDEEG